MSDKDVTIEQSLVLAQKFINGISAGGKQGNFLNMPIAINITNQIKTEKPSLSIAAVNDLEAAMAILLDFLPEPRMESLQQLAVKVATQGRTKERAAKYLGIPNRTIGAHLKQIKLIKIEETNDA